MSRKEKDEYVRMKQRLLDKSGQETVASRQYTSLYVELTENDMPGAIHALDLLLYSVLLSRAKTDNGDDDGSLSPNTKKTISIEEHQRLLDAIKEAGDTQVAQLQELARKREQHILDYMNGVAENEHHRCRALQKTNKRLRTHLLILEAQVKEKQNVAYRDEPNDASSSSSSSGSY